MKRKIRNILGIVKILSVVVVAFFVSTDKCIIMIEQPLCFGGKIRVGSSILNIVKTWAK